jgi:two-component system sensor histidine kinase HydH
MAENKKSYIIVIVVSSLIITYLHYSTIETIHALHDIYMQLYYIPLFVGALVFGLRGALLTYLFVAILYLPYMAGSWTGHFLFETKRVVFLLFSGIFSVLAGFLVDRDRKRKKQMERERYLSGLGQAAAAIVHDLKNPLISLEGFARRVQEGKGDAAAAAGAIMESVQIMQDIVHNVLDFARPIGIEPQEIDARNVITRACELCSGKAGAKGVRLSVDVPDMPLDVIMDGIQVHRALANLVNNAIEASEAGQGVTVRAFPGEGYLSITISDEGSGMDGQTRENLFIPFFTKKMGGTGLGMPIAKKIIEAHRGRIEIRSRPGKGTEIALRLPLGGVSRETPGI